MKESAQIRKAAEVKLDSTEKEFNLKHQLHIQRLGKIGSELDSAELSRLSHQVIKKNQLVSGLYKCLFGKLVIKG